MLTILCDAILHYTVLYYTILYYIALYCTHLARVLEQGDHRRHERGERLEIDQLRDGDEGRADLRLFWNGVL